MRHFCLSGFSSKWPHCLCTQTQTQTVTHTHRHTHTQFHFGGTAKVEISDTSDMRLRGKMAQMESHFTVYEIHETSKRKIASNEYHEQRTWTGDWKDLSRTWTILPPLTHSDTQTLKHTHTHLLNVTHFNTSPVAKRQDEEKTKQRRKELRNT